MQPRNIEVFDGLRITTDHIDHLQGSIHSALADFRGILGLSRVHRGFGVTAVDAHAIRVDPGLAFDAHGRRVVSDEPVTLEVPADVTTSAHFVCVGYDQRADGEVEGHLTRIWDSARVDVRPAPPAIADDAIVIAVLEPAESGEGFTIRMLDENAPPLEPEDAAATMATPAAGASSSSEVAPTTPPFAVRSGLFAMPDAAVDRTVIERMVSAIRAGAASGERVTFIERLRSEEAPAGVIIASLSIDVAARLWRTPADDGGTPGTTWRAEGAGHGQARVGDDGALVQFGAGTSRCDRSPGSSDAHASFVRDSVFTLRPGAPVSSEAAPGDLWLAGLDLSLRCAPRNRDGFAVDASLAWEGKATDAIAAWLEAWTGSLQWMAEGGWSAIGTPISATPTPGG